MTCFYPISATQSFKKKENGKSSISFSEGSDGMPIQLSCGRCIGCRLDKSRQWAVRCVHEAQLHDNNCFITLTYNPENLPPDCGLIHRDYQLFMKRLRKYINKPIKYYMCGEYGENSNRPHYHAVIFGYNFNDWIYLFDSEAGAKIYTSPTLEKIWGLGFVTVGEVTFESAAYVARYLMKKINGPMAEEINEETGLKHYERINSFTGEISSVLPEYANMSRGGRNGRGIAYDWIRRYLSDCYPKNFTVVRGVRMAPPKYYDAYLESLDIEMYDDIKSGRIESMMRSTDNTLARLADREKVKQAQFKMLKRNI